MGDFENDECSTDSRETERGRGRSMIFRNGRETHGRDEISGLGSD